MPRHLLSLNDLSELDLAALVGRAREFADGAQSRSLAGKILGTLFTATSTRTRTAFAVAAGRMGAGIVAYGPHDLQLATGESLADTGRVLSSMLDGLVVRTAGPQSQMQLLAAQQSMSVINAMSTEEHPTQAIGDLALIGNTLGSKDQITMLYMGEGNNTASALAYALARTPNACLHLHTPVGYGLTAEQLTLARKAASEVGASVEQSHEAAHLPADPDIVYTTRWQTTGTDKAEPAWREVFRPFAVTEELMRRFPRASFMHDLPAHRGEEVEAAVLDGAHSIAFEQARYKLFGAMSVLEWCLDSQTR